MRPYLAPFVFTAVAAAAAITTTQAKEWYEEMQIGPAWSESFAGTFDGKEQIAAVKGVLLDLGDGERALFDTETLRVVSIYKGGVHWGGTPWTGAHGQLVKIANEEGLVFNTVPGPGWANEAGSFEDARSQMSFTVYTADRKASAVTAACGNIPQAKYKGFYRSGTRIVFEYTVNGTRILEHLESGPNGVTRYFEVAAHAKPLTVLAADENDSEFKVEGAAAKSGANLSVAAGGESAALKAEGKRLLATLAPATGTTTFTLTYNRGAEAKTVAPLALVGLTTGGEGIWKETITTKGTVSTDTKSPWVTDTLGLPEENPWKSNIRFCGFDFIDEDSAAITTWNGDVWTVKGLKGDLSKLEWKRCAAGLFQPLGLKVVDGVIYVHGRDQITKLHDLNKDGEADYFENFFNGVAVSPNFHEFAFDLQTDKDGNFYFTKAAPVRPGGRGFDTIFPNHGTIMRLSKDASSFEVIGTGLRAPGGVGVGPNGEITTGENEGTWQPCCKLNFITPDQRPAFFGTEPSRQTLKDAPFTEPMLYFPMDTDNSGGSQVWVPADNTKFGLKPGELIHMSYGTSSLFRILPASVDGTLQGGAVKLPVSIGSSAMRARFHKDNSLYVAGFRGWQTNAANETAFQRIRYTGAPVTIPDKLEITETGVRIRFEVELAKDLATDPTSYSASRWNYVRGPQYGSGEFSVDKPDLEAQKIALEKESKEQHTRDNVKVTAARLLADGKTVELDLEGHKPSMSLKVGWDLESGSGEVLKGDLHATVRKMGK
ncbi:DUF6797 domain-containing protein [Haloferula sp. BvORR071]|uniref:DUF6797 domain-containing protein n=1 Tax=Haloferula sp. BvORR071 TaxID=1396141 RepID=UPI000551187D|nr:DUF6797 domain-containing protein [Haloferula sp. BvORR071]